MISTALTNNSARGRSRIAENIPKDRDRAIVMGASMAGLAAARVSSDHYREVILIEGDSFGDIVEHRRGVPQGRHTHGLLSGGREALEQLFPGLSEELISVGAVRANLTRDAHWCFEGGEHVRFESNLEAVLVSRPLLEGMGRRRVREIPNVHIREGRHTEVLIAGRDNRRVTSAETDSEPNIDVVQFMRRDGKEHTYRSRTKKNANDSSGL
ncbi:MAG: hypothetical protein WBQ94_27350 [Terracidiphilus sp.]